MAHTLVSLNFDVVNNRAEVRIKGDGDGFHITMQIDLESDPTKPDFESHVVAATKSAFQKALRAVEGRFQ